MEIKRIDPPSEWALYRALVQLADEEEMLVQYENSGSLFVLFEGAEACGACIVLTEEDSCEIKNIGVAEAHRYKGYARALVQFVKTQYKPFYKTLFVGTGDVPSMKAFYEKLGFVYSHRIKDFFVTNYKNPVVDEGVWLRDMIYYQMQLYEEDQMQKVYEGKTKTVFKLTDGNFLLQFKDDATGENGVFDPGANEVGLSIEGMGKGGLRLTEYFFQKIEGAGYPTHFVSADIEKACMTVKPAEIFGKGLEVICRFKAVGSFIRRYGAYAKEGQPLDAFVEVTLKDDERLDPPISKEALAMLGLIGEAEYDALVKLTKDIAGLIRKELAQKGLELYDIKLEFGRIGGGIALIDEISGGNMRVYKDGKIVAPLALVEYMLG